MERVRYEKLERIGTKRDREGRKRVYLAYPPGGAVPSPVLTIPPNELRRCLREGAIRA